MAKTEPGAYVVWIVRQAAPKQIGRGAIFAESPMRHAQAVLRLP